jgi:hypothetical protein
MMTNKVEFGRIPYSNPNPNETIHDPRKNKYLELLMEIIREYPFSTDDVGVIGTDRIGKLHQLMVEADDTLSKQSPFWDHHIK